MNATINATEFVKRPIRARHLIPGDVLEAPIVGTYTVRDVQLSGFGADGTPQDDDLVALVLDDCHEQPVFVTVPADDFVDVLEPIPADQPEPSWVATITIDPEHLS